MPGAGLTAQNIRAVAEATGACEFHLTGRANRNNPGGEIPDSRR